MWDVRNWNLRRAGESEAEFVARWDRERDEAMAERERERVEHEAVRKADEAAMHAWVAACPVPAGDVLDAFQATRRDDWNSVYVVHYGVRTDRTFGRVTRRAGQSLCAKFTTRTRDSPFAAYSQWELRKSAPCPRCGEVASRHGIDLSSWRPPA